MLRKLMLAKIHRATITQCDPDYVGSITIDEDLLRASGFALYTIGPTPRPIHRPEGGWMQERSAPDPSPRSFRQLWREGIE